MSGRASRWARVLKRSLRIETALVAVAHEVDGRGHPVADGLGVLAEVPRAVEEVGGLDLGHEVGLGGVRVRASAAGQPAEGGPRSALLGPVLLAQDGGERLAGEVQLLAQPGPLAAYTLERLGLVLVLDLGPLQLTPGQAQGVAQARRVCSAPGGRRSSVCCSTRGNLASAARRPRERPLGCVVGTDRRGGVHRTGSSSAGWRSYAASPTRRPSSAGRWWRTRWSTSSPTRAASRCWPPTSRWRTACRRDGRRRGERRVRLLRLRWHNQDRAWNLCGYPEELRHFVTQGWKELRHPSPSFDLWFYWNAHLDPQRGGQPVSTTSEGRRAGLATLPEVRMLPAAPAAGSPAPGVPVRRLRPRRRHRPDRRRLPRRPQPLRRHLLPRRLRDGAVRAGQGRAVHPGRWAIRHGRYDFGSYSMLARDLVGWDGSSSTTSSCWPTTRATSCSPSTRSSPGWRRTACDWWGMQATYEDFTTDDFERLGRPLAIDDVEEQMRQIDLWRYNDFIHVGSYFLGYRGGSSTTPRSAPGWTAWPRRPTRRRSSSSTRSASRGCSSSAATTSRRSSRGSCPTTPSTGSRPSS